MALTLTYDPEADAVYIALSDERPCEAGDEGPLILDYAKDGRVTGIEILSASKVLAPGEWSRAPLPTARRLQAAE